MKTMPANSQMILKWIIEINFFISVIVLIAGGILSISDDGSIFEFNVDLYGPLANNLRMMLIYLAFTEVFLCIGCWLLGKTQFFILSGFSLALLTGSLRVYSIINDIEVDPDLSIFFTYTGLSHIAYGLTAYILKSNPSDTQTGFDRSF